MSAESETRRRRAAYRKQHPFTAAHRVNHVERGLIGDITCGELAIALDEAGFDVDWDTIEDDETPFVVTFEGEVAVVEPTLHPFCKITRWAADAR